MSKIIVLGSGMVGRAMALDLTKQHDVTVADIDKAALDKLKARNSSLDVLQLDVRNSEQLINALQPYDLVVCAVPGFLGFNTLKNIIIAGKNTVDISFFPENCLDLTTLAAEKNVTAIVDCGVAPGMGNIILGYHNEHLKITDFECLVGGLPKIKKWPFAYKAPFSPIDVIEEYTRPARYVENSQLVIREALSDVEMVEFDGVGTLESFNSDGLRSLLFTMPHIRNMKEKTLRYPGHVEYIRVLKSTGFFSTKPIELNGSQIIPVEFTSRLLFNEWKLGETEEEITVMRITIKGSDNNGKKQTLTYHLYDRYHQATNTSSMARTTGYTATAAANLILNGTFSGKGVFPPELIGKNENCFNFIMNYLNERGVQYVKTQFVNE
ncbi:MAG: saccharopine dehydrogenase NADP-binding domain-containing protein [Bacteroidetes bacterium]|jgi:saccharopine dehydrogenase-like NADP-dependent oxidoreductase|nr:saccharopine dehydrogenase NADP-binding domain-containing protein [Bacteroidota bacterium]